MKKTFYSLIALGTLAAAGSLHAADNLPALTPQEFKAVVAKLPQADAKAGAAAHAQRFCSSCHGQAGVSAAKNWPTLAGQPYAVTVKSLLDYRDGRRQGDSTARMMTSAAKTLTDKDIADLAAYYAGLPGSKGDAESAKVSISPQVMRMVAKGDPKRMITPCGACHGADARGNLNGEVPVLHGQTPIYLEAALKQYRANARTSDIVSEMRFFAKQLTDAEIKELAAYYAAQPGAEGLAPESKK